MCLKAGQRSRGQLSVCVAARPSTPPHPVVCPVFVLGQASMLRLPLGSTCEKVCMRSCHTNKCVVVGGFVMVMRTVQSEQRCCPAVLTSQAISAHFLWLSFLQEQWAVVGKLRDARTAAARVMYGRLLAASLHDPAVLSHHPAAVGAYFRLLTLGLKYGRSCLRAGAATAGKDVLLLFDRILQAVRHMPYDQ